MLNQAKIQTQVRRLSGYQAYEDFKRELVRVLWKHAESDEHAERIVTRILDTRQPENGFLKCPTPAEMIEYAEQEPRTVPVAKPDPKCLNCAGTGFRAVVVRGYEAAAPCECRRVA